MATTDGSGVEERCRSCGARSQGAQPFCASCGKVLPPRETNYFEVFGLPRKLGLDAGALEKQFYRFSRKLHPDVYAQASNEEQRWSLAQASLLNDAYRTLKDSVARTQYLLRLEGVQLEDDRQPGEKQTNPSAVPADLLEEVFELNMQLEELRMNRTSGEQDPQLLGGLERSKAQFEGQLGALDQELSSDWQLWDDALEKQDNAAQVAAKESMTALLQRRSYLRNLVRDVGEALGGSES